MAADQNILSFGTNAVYEGFWNDRDRGRILGATLTLRDSRAIPLVAALAIIVGLAGNRSWHISRLLWHTRLHVKDNHTNAAQEHRRKQQVILRDSETAGGATIGLIEVWFDFGFVRAIRECSPKGIILLLYAIGHWVAFIALGVLVSQIVIGKVVVSKTLPTCGQWFPKDVGKTSESDQVYRELTLNLTIDAENYVRSCYPQGGSQGILDCSKFITRSFSSRSEENVSCPFQDTACLPDATSAIIVESGNITFSQLGFNSKYGQELSVHRRSTCAVLDANVFRNYTSPIALADPNNYTRAYSFYKDRETLQDVELPMPGLANELSNSYKLIPFYLPIEPELLHPAFLPRPHNDVSLIMMQNLGIKYLEPQDDPWFSAHGLFKYNNSTGLDPEQEVVLYRTDRFLNLVTCNEQYRFCSSITNQCTTFQGLLQGDFLDVANYITLLGHNDLTDTKDVEDFQLVSILLELLMPSTALPSSIASRGGDVLQANRYLQEGRQNKLSTTQWVQELKFWFIVALSRLQLSVFNTIERPTNLDDSRVFNHWTSTPELSQLLIICGRIKFKDPNHTSLSVFGLIMILVFSGVLTLGSLIGLFLPSIPKINRWRPITDWKRDEMLALLEKTKDEATPEIREPDMEYDSIAVDGGKTPSPMTA